MPQTPSRFLTPVPRATRRSRTARPLSTPAHDGPCLHELTHYRAEYAYRPEHTYTETHTTDPHYVVYGVRLMSSRQHGTALDQFSNAFKILKPPSTSDVHISREVGIVGIPGSFFTAPRHTGNLEPDLSVWAGPPPADPWLSYPYAEWGAPLLVVEVVSHSTQEVRDNDWHHKRYTYARMGIREYWMLDMEAAEPLTGFTLDGRDGTPCTLSQYRRLVPDAEGGLDSRVLGVLLRWRNGALQCWTQALAAWTVIEDMPVVQGRREGRHEGEVISWERIVHLHRLLDAAEPGAVDIVLHAWTENPPATWPSDETLDKLEVDPGAWRHLLLA